MRYTTTIKIIIFLLSNQKAGNIKYVITAGIIFVITSNISIDIILYFTNFNYFFEFIALCYVGILNVVILILCIQLHHQHDLDNYSIRREFTMYTVIIILIEGGMYTKKKKYLYDIFKMPERNKLYTNNTKK